MTMWRSILILLLLAALRFNSMATLTITSLTTDKARYDPGEIVAIAATTQASEAQHCTVSITIHHLENKTDILLEQDVLIAKGYDRIILKWKTPSRDFSGYYVLLECKTNTQSLASASTAIDVSSDWARFPRYGYIADFEEMPREDIYRTINRLTSCHINGLQFYDWQWKHQKPFPGTVDQPADSWEEIARRPVSRRTVETYINAAHHANMMAMNYNLLFGALDEYEKDGVDPAWGLFGRDDGTEPDTHDLPDAWLSSRIHIMNPANTNWQDFIISREKEVHHLFAFDGWHIDQLGGRGDRYTQDGKPVDLAKTYGPFLERTLSEMKTRLVMNSVGSYALTEIAQTDGLDFLYTEVWPWEGCQNYGHLKDVIERGWRDSNHQYNMVLAAYMNYEFKDRDHFNLPGVIMTDAVIFSAGGSHLELGDHGLLCSEYFPNRRLSMTRNLETKLHAYYSFSVAYQNWLRDLSIRPIKRAIHSETPNINFQPYDTPGHIWHYSRQHGKDEILHLINLTGHSHNDWRDDRGDQPTPPLLGPIKFKYFTDATINEIYTASPDSDNGQLIKASYKRMEGKNGGYLITIPSLEYWRMVVLKTD